ncbi:YkgJ family cysteine cluster protein [Desulfococcaceae bacterium HSG8]|nr:YkgJ family cysteine cluster protein [Desulfococcaceae bacterium HSG8]
MRTDFAPFFKKYEELVTAADTVFKQVATEHQDCVKCRVGCSDCCYALFDLTLIEALYINRKFNQEFKEKERERLIEKANRSDRDIYKLKRKAYKDLESGRKEDDILAEIAQQRIRCPLLNDEDACDLYEYRPITCRFYGIPTAIGGKGHTCGLSAFAQGQQYPTVNLDVIHKKLYEISEELVKEIRSKYARMSEMLVPVSMAMITNYDDVYLGIADEDEESKK